MADARAAAMQPGVILRLDEVVVNRIAAGEIIRRPANALKEMIENSLDAKSTAIQITVKDGGLKMLQIQDNGTGIRKEDLEIICERFTTSKLQQFEDLSAISTYGFRGEALASISHVAHLTIQTKTVGAQCAFKASYSDSKLLAPAKATAGNQGTQITVEDLFYNVPQRKQALKSVADEFHQISDVVSKYAVHNAHVSFTLKKSGEKNSVRTLANSTNRQNIGTIFGAGISKELLDVALDDTTLRFKMHGHITNVNYSSKKSVILLFINHRLVESSSLKAAIDEIYGIYLPKGAHPFVYVSLLIDAQNVDVNVHPTKHEVHFLHEDEITDRIKQAIEQTLLGSNESRKFYAQTLLPGATDPTERKDTPEGKEKVVYEKDMVRTDSSSQKLEKFFGNTTLLSASLQQSRLGEDLSTLDESESMNDTKDIISIKSTIVPKSNPFQARSLNKNRKVTKLTSILRMRKQCERNCNTELRAILNDMIFVGAVDRTKALVQYDTKMYLCDTKKLSEELFYQLLLYDFENFGHMKFAEPGLAIRDLALRELALRSEESGWTVDDGPIEELAATVADIIVEKTPILREYYAFEVSPDGNLLQLPVLIQNHQPSLAHLPMYLLRLATEVDWDDEAKFFETFSRETASYYSTIPMAHTEAPDIFTSNDSPAEQEDVAWKWHTEHVLYATMKEYLLPSAEFLRNMSFLVVASLPKLYKVFERC